MAMFSSDALVLDLTHSPNAYDFSGKETTSESQMRLPVIQEILKTSILALQSDSL